MTKPFSMSRVAITELSHNKVKGLTGAEPVEVVAHSDLFREGADPLSTLV
jgi:hypothetical protein